LLLSDAGRIIVAKVLVKIEEHAAYAREHSVAEVYVKVINDLGINDRVVHPALVREAAYLNTFYQRILRFELDTQDISLASYLNYIKLELESGEEGQLPTDYEEGPETVKVITVHSAKGLEWKYVFLVQLVDRRFPSTERREAIELPRELIKEQLPEGDVHLQEERRLFYVGLTRARDGLFVTRAEDYFGKTTRKASRFLHELGMVSNETMSTPTGKVTKLAMPEVVAKPTARYPIPESFSFSSVSSFRKCPLEYKYRHLLKLPSPGGPALSYGSTIHKTVELFLKLWQSRQSAVQADLFGKTPAAGTLPTFDDLMDLYDKSWIDDWYDSKQQKAEYRTKKGPAHLKNFYDTFAAAPPTTKYIEQFFKIGMGPYKFTGKIDRLDVVPGGGAIIDYKTTKQNINNLFNDD
ncbi:MAG: 3'-5' exonuclease, partial [Patescibacteria group bacterium]